MVITELERAIIETFRRSNESIQHAVLMTLDLPEPESIHENRLKRIQTSTKDELQIARRQRKERELYTERVKQYIESGHLLPAEIGKSTTRQP